MTATPSPSPDKLRRLIANAVWGAIVVVLAVVVAWLVLARFGVVAGPPASKMTPTSQGNPKNKAAYLSKDDPSERTDSLGPRKWHIVDIHEHLKGEDEAKKLIDAMDKFGIQRTCLMGSTTYTLTLNPIYGFEGFKDNNETLLQVKKNHPERFCVFITFNPLDEGNLELVKDYVARGADGVKLYLGHGEKTGKGPFHVMPLDDPRMEAFWAWAEEVQLPVLCHINLNKFWDETLRLLERHPYLRLTIPHFGLYKNSEGKLNRLEWLLKRYPNVYTDTSFGYYTFQIEGFEALGKFRSRSKAWLTRNKDRVMYASDMVLEPSKDEPYILDTMRSYLQFLERERWRLFLVPDKTMHGMGLDDDTLAAIYERTPKSFLLLDDKGALPDRTKGWPIEGVPVPARPAIPPLDPSTIPSLKPTTVAPATPSPGPGESDDGKDGKDDDKSAGCEHEEDD